MRVHGKSSKKKDYPGILWLRKKWGVKIVKMCTLCHRACTESVYVTEHTEEGLGVKIVKMCTLCHRACTESVYVTEHTFLLGTAKKCMNTCIHRYYWMVYTLHVKNVQQNYKNVQYTFKKTGFT